MYPPDLTNNKDKDKDNMTEQYKEEDQPPLLCTTCAVEIVRDSRAHDECMLVNKGDDLICADCPWVCNAGCGECFVCENKEEDEEDRQYFKVVDGGNPDVDYFDTLDEAKAFCDKHESLDYGLIMLCDWKKQEIGDWGDYVDKFEPICCVGCGKDGVYPEDFCGDTMCPDCFEEEVEV